MRNISNFFILIMLIFPINTFCQNINSYNIDAKLNSEDKTMTVSQSMKFKNTSNISLNKIVLEDWANSYVDNRTSLAKRISIIGTPRIGSSTFPGSLVDPILA